MSVKEEIREPIGIRTPPLCFPVRTQHGIALN
jgi:hypothetical protein